MTKLRTLQSYCIILQTDKSECFYMYIWKKSTLKIINDLKCVLIDNSLCQLALTIKKNNIQNKSRTCHVDQLLKTIAIFSGNSVIHTNIPEQYGYKRGQLKAPLPLKSCHANLN